jgi:Helix-turn-helix domain
LDDKEVDQDGLRLLDAILGGYFLSRKGMDRQLSDQSKKQKHGGGFSKLPHEIGEEIIGCGPREAQVYMAMMGYINKYRKCWPSLKTLSNQCKCSVRTVQRVLANLQKAGLVQIENRTASSSIYTLTPSFGGDTDVMGVRHECRGGGDADVTHNKNQLTRTTIKKVVSYEKAKNPARVDTEDDIGDRHWTP